MKHITIYKEPGRYAAWPANYGIWSWGNEIVVGFTSGYHLTDGGFHARDRSKPFTTMQARSLDGGETWQTEIMPVRTPGNRGLSTGEHLDPNGAGASASEDVNAPIPYPAELRFDDPSFAMIFARMDVTGESKSWFYTSMDHCHSWQGPYILPGMGLVGISARTDYSVISASECLLFLTAPTALGTETGSRVFCARTTDSGKNYEFASWIGPEIDHGFLIMPASVRLSDTHLLVAIRGRKTTDDDQSVNWIDLYGSTDNGETWEYVSQPVPDTGNGGNPATLTALLDGRLCITYGYRNAPYGIRAKLSSDNGLTWGDEIILRSDAGSHDIGYTRTVQRPDGTLVVVYYFNDELGGSCYIGTTLWKP